MQDDDPADSPEDPLAGLLREPEVGHVPAGGAGAAAFQQRAQLAEDRLAEVLNAYRQLKTDNEASRERVTKNLERRFEQRRERLLLKFIEILDNLDRALEATEQVYTGTPMIEGIILVRTQLLSTLKDEGLERIPVLGLPYDPSVAEAVETRPVTEAEHHHVVVKELMRGYRLNGRVARAARVAVGEHRPEESPEETAGEALVGADEVSALPLAAAVAAASVLEVADPEPSDPETLDTVDALDADDPLDPTLEVEPDVPSAEPPAVRGFDDALDDLLAEPAEAPPAAPARAARPAPEVAAKPKSKAEIDLLREVLDDDEA